MSADGWLFFDSIGTAGEWVAGLGTLSAVGLALGIERRAQRQRAQEELRHATDLASLFVVRGTGGATRAGSTGWSWSFYVENRGMLNVYDVDVQVDDGDGRRNAKRIAVLRPTDGQHRGEADGHANQPVTWTATFTDSEGRRWLQDEQGRARPAETDLTRPKARRRARRRRSAE